MAKPVVIEVNNKCGCCWIPGNTVTLTNQHPDGNAPWTAHAFACKVLDDRGLYLYVDSRPSGYRFWCTQCKNNDPMSFTYLTDQQTEFIASVQRRFNIVDDQKKKLEKRIQELTDTLEQERAHFEKTLADQTEAAETALSKALEDATARDTAYKLKEAQWLKEEAARTEYNTKKKDGLALIPEIGRFDFHKWARDDMGEESRDFMRAAEEMTKLVTALLNVQGNIESCAKQEARLETNPLPSVEKKNATMLKLLIDVYGSEAHGSNCVPLLDPSNEVGKLMQMLQAQDQQQQQASSSPKSEKDDSTAAGSQAGAGSMRGGAVSDKDKDKDKETQPVVHVPFEFLGNNAATQNIRRLPKTNYRLCPNHDVCSQESSCTYFHLKCIKLRFPRSGEMMVPGAFVLNKADLQNPPSSGRGGSNSVPEGCIEPNCHCRSRVHLHPAAAKLLFPTWHERDDIWKHCVATTESDHMSTNLDDLKKEKHRFERFLGRHPNVLTGGKNNNNNSGSGDDNKDGGGAENEKQQQDEEEEEEDNSCYPDGSIDALKEATFNAFAKARQNMMTEFERCREMTQLLATFDFHCLQVQEYSEAMRRFFRVPRDLDALIKKITDTALRYGELMKLPKPSLAMEGKCFAVGVALVIRETERTFEELQLLRDRVDVYRGHIEKSAKAHVVEHEIELVERAIDHKQKELLRAKKKIELLDADIEVLADAEDEFEMNEKKTERNKTVNEAQTKHRELAQLQEQHHEKFLVLAEVKQTILPDFDLRDSEQKRWHELLGGAGNAEALPHSKNVVEFVKHRRGGAGMSP